RIWKYSVQSLRKWKRKSLLIALRKLQDNKNEYKKKYYPKITYLFSIYSKKMLIYYFHYWILQRKRKSLLKKFLLVGKTKRKLWACWNKWKSIIPPKISTFIAPLSSPKFSPKEPSPTRFTKAVYQGPNNNVVRSIVKRKKMKINWNAMTALQRLEY